MVDRLLRWVWDNVPGPVQVRVPWPVYRWFEHAADRADMAELGDRPPRKSIWEGVDHEWW